MELLEYLAAQRKGGEREDVQRHKVRFSRVPGLFAVCQLSSDVSIPDWATQGTFFSITRTPDELSVVCLEAQVPGSVQHENDWACLKLEGPFPFAETGILSSFVDPLCDRAIPVFAISTFDTDYVLVKSSWLETAVGILKDVGHREV
jgi:uncharacterized protein